MNASSNQATPNPCALNKDVFKMDIGLR